MCIRSMNKIPVQHKPEYKAFYVCIRPMNDTSVQHKQECKRVIPMYGSTTDTSVLQTIAEQIRHHQSQRQKLEYYICMVPAKRIICERVR